MNSWRNISWRVVRNHDRGCRGKKKLKNLWPIRTSDQQSLRPSWFHKQNSDFAQYMKPHCERHEMIYNGHEYDDDSHDIFHDGGYNFMTSQKSTFQMSPNLSKQRVWPNWVCKILAARISFHVCVCVWQSFWRQISAQLSLWWVPHSAAPWAAGVPFSLLCTQLPFWIMSSNQRPKHADWRSLLHAFFAFT